MADNPIGEHRLASLRHRWEQDPTSRLFVQLAEAYRRQGEVGQALEVLNQGLEHHPNYLSAMIVEARCRLEVGDPEQALRVLDGVVQRDPTHLVAGQLLVEAHLQAGDRQAAREALERYRLLGAGGDEFDELERRANDTTPPPAPAVEPGEPEKMAERASPPPPSPGPRTDSPTRLATPPFGSSSVGGHQRSETSLETDGPFALAAADPAPLSLPAGPDERAPRHLYQIGADRPFRGLQGEAEALRGEVFRLVPREAVARPADTPPISAGETIGTAGEPIEPYDASVDSPGTEVAGTTSGVADEVVDALEEPWLEDELRGAGEVSEAPAEPLVDSAEPSGTVAADADGSEDVGLGFPEPDPDQDRLGPLEPLSEEPPEQVEGGDEVAEAKTAELSLGSEMVPSTDPEEPAADLFAEAEPSGGLTAATELEPVQTHHPEGEAGAEPSVDEDSATVTLGELYRRQGHPEEAERVFRRVLARDPGNAEALRGLEALDQDLAPAASELAATAPEDSSRPTAAPLTAQDLLGEDGVGERGLTARKLLLLQRYLTRVQGKGQADVS